MYADRVSNETSDEQIPTENRFKVIFEADGVVTKATPDDGEPS